MGPYMLCSCNGIISEASDHKCEDCGRTVGEVISSLETESRVYGNLAKIFGKAFNRMNGQK